jgi:hypothetical protein
MQSQSFVTLLLYMHDDAYGNSLHRQKGKTWTTNAIAVAELCS